MTIAYVERITHVDSDTDGPYRFVWRGCCYIVQRQIKRWVELIHEGLGGELRCFRVEADGATLDLQENSRSGEWHVRREWI